MTDPVKTDSVRPSDKEATPSKMTQYLPKKAFGDWLKEQNKRRIYAEDIKRHIDKGSLKTETGLTKMVGISAVLVDEDGIAKGLKENRTLRYNKDYRDWNGDKPLYGTVVIVLSDKAYDALDDAKKTPFEEITFA